MSDSRRQHEVDRVLAGLREQGPQLLGRLVGDGDVQRLLVDAQRHDHEAPGHVLRHQRNRRRFGVVPSQVDDRHAEDLTEHVREIALAEDAHLDEDVPEPLAGFLLMDAGLGDLRIVRQAAFDEDVDDAGLGRLVVLSHLRSGLVGNRLRRRDDRGGTSPACPTTCHWSGGAPFPDGTDEPQRRRQSTVVGVFFLPAELHGRSTVVRIEQAAIASSYFSRWPASRALRPVMARHLGSVGSRPPIPAVLRPQSQSGAVAMALARDA